METATAEQIIGQINAEIGTWTIDRGYVFALRADDRMFAVGDILPHSKSTDGRIGVHEPDAELLPGTCAYSLECRADVAELIEAGLSKNVDWSNLYLVVGRQVDAYIQDDYEIVLDECEVVMHVLSVW